MRSASLVVALLVVAAASAQAQTPSLTNGTLETRAVTRPLEQEFDAMTSKNAGPAWIGYAIPTAPRRGDEGCWSSDGNYALRPAGPLKLEGPDSMFILYRVADRRVERIRIASSQCPLDAGGLTV